MLNRRIVRHIRHQFEPGEFLPLKPGDVLAPDHEFFDHWFIVENSDPTDAEATVSFSRAPAPVQDGAQVSEAAQEEGQGAEVAQDGAQDDGDGAQAPRAGGRKGKP